MTFDLISLAFNVLFMFLRRLTGGLMTVPKTVPTSAQFEVSNCPYTTHNDTYEAFLLCAAGSDGAHTRGYVLQTDRKHISAMPCETRDVPSPLIVFVEGL